MSPLPHPAAASRRALVSTVSALTAAVLAAVSVAPAHATGPGSATSAARARIAAVTLTKLSVDGSTITIAGRVRLPVNTARERRRTLVWLTLTSGAGATEQSERFTAKLSAEDRFLAAHTTKLTGTLGLSVLVRIGGKPSGRKTLGTLEVADSATPGSPGTSGAGSSSSSPSSSGSSSSSSSPSGPGPTPPTTLNGTFELETGREGASPVPVGSWFEMFDPPTETTPLPNVNSPLKNQDYTPLSAGTEGGLETFAYQPAPSPAFSEKGNALADEIMQPQNFFAVNFSVVTQETDPQTGEADPKPVIVDDNGQLSGQISAWAVGWNNQWFNQGSPKPNSKEPFPTGTTAVSGTYDETTGHYVLEWKSLIVGGPFATHAGLWHLEGTFVPSS
jgi:hypothetical protein